MAVPRTTKNAAYLATLPPHLIARLHFFAQQRGHNWKARLRRIWLLGQDADSPYLREARNLIGPSGLDKFTSEDLYHAYQQVPKA
jgi:hypothetical protein